MKPYPTTPKPNPSSATILPGPTLPKPNLSPATLQGPTLPKPSPSPATPLIDYMWIYDDETISKPGLVVGIDFGTT